MTERVDPPHERAERDADRIRRAAEQDAEEIRRTAIVAAERLLNRLEALEFPLGELVLSIRDEVEQATSELQGRAPTGESWLPASDLGDTPQDEELTPSPVEDRHPVSQKAQDPGAPSGSAELAADAVERPSRMPSANRAAQPREAEAKQGGRLGWRKSKPLKDMFITVEGSCAICQRPFKAGSEDDLARSGWKVNGDVGLCPDCQEDRWQLPEGARLPFRRGG